MTAMAELQARGADPALIRIISVVAAPQLCKTEVAYPGLVIYTATIDEGVNDRGLLCLGWETGDRTLALNFNPHKGLINKPQPKLFISHLFTESICCHPILNWNQPEQLAVNLENCSFLKA